MKKSLLLMLFLALTWSWTAKADQLNEGFENSDFPPSDWTSIHVSGANSWAKYTTNKHSGSASAYAHWANAGHENYLITPKLEPSNGESLSFFVSAQSYTGTTLKIEVSVKDPIATDFTTELATYTTGSTGTIGTTSPSTFVEKTIDLSGYVGQQIYIAFHVIDNNGGDVIIDDVTGVSLYVPSCVKPASLGVSNMDAHSAILTWGATSGVYNVEYKEDSKSEWTSAGVNLSVETVTLSGLKASTTYEARVQSVCTGETSDWKTISFTTPCEAISTFPWSEDFNSLTAGIPMCWNNSDGTTTTDSYKWNYYATGHEGAGLRFNSYSNSSGNTNFLKTPEINLPASPAMRLNFWYKNPAGGDFSVYISTDGGATYTTALALGLIGASAWIKHEDIDLSDYAGQDVVIVFKGTSNYGNGDAYIYLDDVAISEIPSCLAPTELSASKITTNSAELSWTNGGTESAWKVFMKKASAADFGDAIEVDSNPYLMENLDPATVYQFKVVAACGGSEESEESLIASFTTACDAITSFPWSENFEAYAAGDFAAPCWINEHISGAGTQIFKVYTSTNGSNSTHQLQLPDMSAGTLTKLTLPEMTLPNANYQFVLDVYRNNSTYNDNYPYEGIRVFVSADGEIEGATELAFIPRQYDVANGSIPAESAVGWYTYELPLGVSGSCFIILRGESQFCTSTYMDNFSVEQILSCRRPSAPKCLDKTAHTAKLTWTLGEEGQSAWQIAVDTIAAFNPDTVSVLANLFDAADDTVVISGLRAGKLYYAYVRANCGTDGYSAWSKSYVSFLTASGKAAPTNLAVIDATITSSEAKVNWKLVKTNDLHQSFDLYYSVLNTMPSALDPDSLIENITDTFYLFQNLDTEKTYYVWVRDNCGEDGLSAWSSRASFTTAASCQTPDGLAAADITASSASISWNTYGQTGFNLRYGTDGTNWTTANGIKSNSYLIDGLEADTEYSVQVQPECNPAAWSSVYNFTTNEACPDGKVCVGSGKTVNGYLPTYAYYNYSLTQQIYTASELGDAGAILSIDLHASIAVTRNLDIYMVSTSKNAFADASDWIAVTASDLVYSGNISFVAGDWTNIEFANPFIYDGTSNVVLIIDDNTGSYENTYPNFYVFDAANQALRVYDDGTNFDPTSSAITDTDKAKMNVKNRVRFEIGDVPSCFKPTGLEINYTGGLTAEVSWTGEATSYNIDVNGVVTNGVTSPYELSGLELATTYEVKVQADCGSGNLSDWTSVASFTTDLCMPEDQCILTFELTDSYGDSWNGNAIRVTDVLSGKVLGELANENLNGATGAGTNELNIKTLAVCNGREIQFSWVTGSYPTETSWVVKDVNGQVLFSGAGTSSMETGDILYTHTVDCTRKFYLEIGTSGYATFYDEDYAYTMPANLSGHIFNAATGLSDAIYEANQIIPAKEPLVMKAADDVVLPETFVLVEAETDALPSAGNDLQGNNEEGIIGSATDGNVYYVLSLNAAGEDESVGFYYMLENGVGGFIMPAHKAYLQYSASGAPAQFFLFNGENGATGLNSLEGVEGTVKFLHEGKIFILREGVIYDDTGRKVSEF